MAAADGSGTGLEPLRVRLEHARARAPRRASDDAAGYDLASCAAATVPAGGRASIATGVRLLGMPAGTYGRVAPRATLALRYGLAVGAGVVDRGSLVRVVLFNHSKMDFRVRPGDRVAQLVLERLVAPDVEVEEDASDEGDDEETVRRPGRKGRRRRRRRSAARIATDVPEADA